MTDQAEREKQVEEGVMNALEGGPRGGLTGPQIHSVAPGSWEEISVALARLSARGVLISHANEKFGGPYPRYQLAEGRKTDR